MKPRPCSASAPFPPSFTIKKSKILSALSIPSCHYDDLSPKGSIDEGVRELIDEINELEGFVTTSSCAGRISVFLEGKKGALEREEDGPNRSDENEERGTVAGVGGKGGGGRWLFVSHDPVELGLEGEKLMDMLGFGTVEDRGAEVRGSESVRDVRFVHFKFEPMVCLLDHSKLQG